MANEEPTVNVVADGGPGVVVAEWPAGQYPLAWKRALSLDDSGGLCAEYSVTNAHTVPLPFIWGLSQFFKWSDGVSIDIPGGARSRVAARLGNGQLSCSNEFAWPMFRDGGHLVDLSRPSNLGQHAGVLCYVELPRGRFVLRVDNDALEVTGDTNLVTHARLMLDNDTGDHRALRKNWWRRRVPRRSLSVGLAVGAPELLSEAVSASREARWVEPGETAVWSVGVRAIASAEPPEA